MKVEGNSRINFRAGLTKQIRNDIKSCNVEQISRALDQYYSIPSNFKGNKVLAWCSLVCVQLIEYMNYNFNTNFGFPNGIYVEDLEKTALCVRDTPGLVNIKPEFIHYDDATCIKENSIIFNEYAEDNYKGGNKFWDEIDSFADENFEEKIYGTNHFIEMILHEFSHAMHYNNLINKNGKNGAIKKLKKILNPNSIPQYHYINKGLIQKNICKYATVNPFETIACDLTKRIIDNMGQDTLLIKNNFIPQSPYRHQNKLEMFLSKLKNAKTEEEEFSKLISNYWNGIFKK